MELITKLEDYANDIAIRKKIGNATENVKTYIGKGVKIIKAYSKLDITVSAITAFAFGSLLSAIFSKVAKKLIVLSAILFTLGSAYFIYKKFFE